MAKPQKDNSFRFSFDPRNVNSKFPALRSCIKVRSNEIHLAAWVNKNEYGYSVAGDVTQLVPFMRALFGQFPKEQKDESRPDPQQAQQPATPKREEKPEDRKSLLR